MRSVAIVAITFSAVLVASSCGDDDDTGPTCPATADCTGRVCGPDPVCLTSCGTCTGGETCNASGQCVNTNPTGEEACMRFYQTGCERFLRCWPTGVCPADGTTLVRSAEDCYSCYGARDVCATVYGASAPLNAADMATFERCDGNLGDAACGSFNEATWGAYDWDESCSLF